MSRPTIHTVGHGTMSELAFAELARNAGVRALVDVRSYPGSHRNPQFGQDQMERWLPAAGISYDWMRDLGGRRRPVDGSRHVALRHASFRAYADHMDTPEFLAAVGQLLDGPEAQAVMCSETLWWRCHRRLLADHLTMIDDVEVLHLMHDGRLVPHKPTDGVRLDRDRLTYDLSSTRPSLNSTAPRT